MRYSHQITNPVGVSPQGYFILNIIRLRMNSDSLRGEAMSNSKSRLKTTKRTPQKK